MDKEKAKLGIGTKTTALQPKKIEVVDVKVQTAKDRNDKEIGEKVVLICKHPDREQTIELSQVKYEKGSKIDITGLWLKLDEDGKIPKDSALATLMRFCNADELGDLVGKTISTATGERGFLVLRAY